MTKLLFIIAKCALFTHSTSSKHCWNHPFLPLSPCPTLAASHFWNILPFIYPHGSLHHLLQDMTQTFFSQKGRSTPHLLRNATSSFKLKHLGFPLTYLRFLFSYSNHHPVPYYLISVSVTFIPYCIFFSSRMHASMRAGISDYFVQ